MYNFSRLLNICKNNRRGSDTTPNTEDGTSLINGSISNIGTHGQITTPPNHAEDGLMGSPPASAPPADDQSEPENRDIASNEGKHKNSEDEHTNALLENRELTGEMTANTPQGKIRSIYIL